MSGDNCIYICTTDSDALCIAIDILSIFKLLQIELRVVANKQLEASCNTALFDTLPHHRSVQLVRAFACDADDRTIL